METNLTRELEAFECLQNRESAHCRITRVGPSILKIEPRSSETRKKLSLGVLALVHGNEVLGVPIVNQLLHKLFVGDIDFDLDIYVALGNIPAALKGQRYIGTDLNRSFGLRRRESPEDVRARELEKFMLNHCDYLIDLHQTVEATRNAFFIFQYSSARCLAFLREINSNIPVILQMDSIGDGSGLASDEYVRNKGGFGTTLELGQVGFTQNYFEMGLSVCERAIRILNSYPDFSRTSIETLGEVKFPLYKLSEPYRVMEPGTSLLPGWQNLQEIPAGTEIGKSKKGPIHMPLKGCLLFPNYSSRLSRGQNLFYVGANVQVRELSRPTEDSILAELV